jgi:hypothetical protein
VLDDTLVTTSADLSSDTPHDVQDLPITAEIQLTMYNDFAHTLEPVTMQPHGTLELFRISPKTSLSPIFEEKCTSLADKMQHLVILDKLKPGLSLELHLMVLVMSHSEVVLWPFFQSATTGNLIQFLPWDLGQPWSGRGTMLSALEYELVVLLTAYSGVACLHENSLHELCNCSFEAATILNWMVKLMELHPWHYPVLKPWPSWDLPLQIPSLVRAAFATCR